MDRSVARGREAGSGRGARPGAGRPRAWLPIILALGSALAPAGVSGQQPVPAAGTTPAADTVPADSTLTARQRALARLRAMRVDPVQPDTTPTDSAAADSAAADTGSAEIVVEGEPAPGVDEPRSTPDDPLRRPLRPGRDPMLAPDDTLIVFTDDTPSVDRVMVEDSLRALLQSLAGYQVTEYEGDAAIYSTETRQLELRGAPRVGRGPEGLEADSLLVYEGATGIVCGYGSPVLSGGNQDPVESDELCFNIERNIGMARGARTKFQQGATWYVRGAENRVYLLTGGEKNALYGEHAEFTSCDLEHPHYTFKARSLKMVEGDMMVARNITLEFEDVPVFWLPWMVQSMKRDRRSGLLMPEFGVNEIVRNNSGYNRSLSNLGFYWAINDYASAKGTFEWYSNNWTAVEGALTYRWLRQFLQGNLTAKQYWRQQQGLAGARSRELTINTSNSWQPDERTRLQLNANYATSAQFVEDNSFDPRELNRNITSSASINRSFDWGTMSLGADRREQLSTGQVEWKLPGLALNISPVTLWQPSEGLGLTWNGSGNVTNRTRHVPDTLGTRDTRTLDARYSQSLSFGKLGLSQNITWYDEAVQGPSTGPALPGLGGGFGAGLDGSGIDGVVDRVGSPGFLLDEDREERLGWFTSLSYQQVLWAGTVLSPSVSINGNQIRDDRTFGDFVAEPNRISAGATLNTSVYGFWPGFGNFSRIRHKIAPTLRWSYSPAPSFSALQEEIFGVRNLREQNRLTLSFNQTFEAKVREDATADTAAAVDTASTDGSAAGSTGLAAGERPSGEPRRLPRAEKVMLLALDTRTSFVYDFVAASEEGRGFLTEEIQNSIRSDLLRGFQLSMAHSLFAKEPATEGQLEPRRFDPYLTDVSASFSIDNNFWLFGFLGLTSSADGPAGPGADAGTMDPEAEGVANSDDPSVGAESDPERTSGPGSIIPNRGPQDEMRSGVGGWRAAFNYSFRRSRPTLTRPETGENQLLSGNVSFQPTELWSLRWSTAYSLTDSEFANHVLTLTRDLHRWQANFDFVKAQNGNFLFSFRVQLRDNPDLKLDYDQREGPAERGARLPRGTQ